MGGVVWNFLAWGQPCQLEDPVMIQLYGVFEKMVSLPVSVPEKREEKGDCGVCLAA
jgi:hypothetical protein